MSGFGAGWVVGMITAAVLLIYTGRTPPDVCASAYGVPSDRASFHDGKCWLQSETALENQKP